MGRRHLDQLSVVAPCDLGADHDQAAATTNGTRRGGQNPVVLKSLDNIER